jgi:histidinol-phosphate phosphatase family protein
MSPTAIVVPTMGRPSLDVLLDALARQRHPVDAPIVLVDDRRTGPDLTPDSRGLDVTVVRSGGGGPARARNLGWRRARTTWVSFLDDDVVPDEDWYELLHHDLRTDALGSCGRVRVPLPAERRPTDWERGTAGLAGSRWITADLSYRREALAGVGGFDERFPRAFREDADLALRLGATLDERSTIVTGQRWITHPVRPSDDWASLRQQAGNADDMLMRRLHGRGWQRRAGAPVGRRAAHVATTAAGVAALGSLAWDAIRRPRRRVPARMTSAGMASVVAAGVWLAGTAEFAWRRIAPGPRDHDEVRRMLLTSLAIPPAATWHTARGLVRHRHATRWRGLPDLVLLDRDGTLVHDVPYNGDPARVTPVDGAREALDRLRREGVRVALVTNQSGVARGLISAEQVRAVNDRVAELLGPFDGVYVCPHGPDDGCECRKPAPGLVKQALAEAGVAPARAVMIGDIGSDLAAAGAAGVAGVLVPTRQTLPDEVAAAETVATTLPAAVDAVLRGAW